MIVQEPEPIDWEYYRKGIGNKLVDMYKEAYDGMIPCSLLSIFLSRKVFFEVVYIALHGCWKLKCWCYWGRKIEPDVVVELVSRDFLVLYCTMILKIWHILLLLGIYSSVWNITYVERLVPLETWLKLWCQLSWSI